MFYDLIGTYLTVPFCRGITRLPASHFLVRPSIDSSTQLSGEHCCWSFLDYVEDIFLAGRLLLPSLKLFHFYTICIIPIETVYTA